MKRVKLSFSIRSSLVLSALLLHHAAFAADPLPRGDPLKAGFSQAGLDRIDSALRAAYADAGASEKWKLLRYDIGHFETAEMRSEVVNFLEKWL